MIAQKGNIFVTILILILIAGGIFGVYKLSLESLPGQFLYPIKAELENLRLATTELSRVKRALIYIDFANERLDEAEILSEKGKNPDKIIQVLHKFLNNVQLAVETTKKETARVEDSAQVFEQLKILREKQEVLLTRILEKTSDPQFYEVLDIKNQAMEVLNEYNLR